MLDDDMVRVVEEQRLGLVATASPDGTPNLSPKGTTAVWDAEHLVFAAIPAPPRGPDVRFGSFAPGGAASTVPRCSQAHRPSSGGSRRCRDGGGGC